MTHPKILPGPFHLSAKLKKKKVFVESKLIDGVARVIFTCLSQVDEGFRQASSIYTFNQTFFPAPHDSKASLKLSEQN